MKILLIASEPPLRDDDVASGNAVRAAQLTAAMIEAAHEVIHVWLTGPGQDAPRDAFRNRDELQGLILRHAPAVLLVAYWELLGLLPLEPAMPVILDFVAPRPLETLFERPDQARLELRRLRATLPRCDLLLTGNDRQKHLLVHDLLDAGLDLRGGLPVIAVPPGADLAPAPARPPAAGWTLVAGGVRWPWRDEGRWLTALGAAVDSGPAPARIVHFRGPYRWHAEERSDDPAPPIPGVEQRQLLPYKEYLQFLATDARIGLELADWNLEREYSQSFRLLDFLRHGLPVICNGYLPLAAAVAECDAGWLVDRPEDLPQLWADIASRRDDWQKKSDGALRLVRERLLPGLAAAGLVEWLERPRKAPRLPAARAAAEPVLGVPPLGRRLARQTALARQVALRKLFTRREARAGVLFVTRGDLFPPDHGAAVRTVETARALGASGLPVGIVTDEPGHWYRYEDGAFTSQSYPAWVRLLRWPEPVAKLLHYSKDLPQSNAFLYLPLSDRSFRWRILAASKALRPAVLQAEFPAYAAPCLMLREILECPVVLVEHNVEYARLRQQLPDLTDAQFESLKAIEIDLCRRADAVVCVSDNDRQRLADDGVDPGRMHLIPHGVTLARYEAAPQHGLRERYGIGERDLLLAFHGTFSYPPNRVAIGVLADTLLPALQRHGISAHVLAIGRDPLSSSPHPRIHFTGPVADLAPWLKAADLAVIPLTEGGGTRMKIVDCFAAGLPVVSTSKGIEGIPVVPGTHAVIVDDWDEMAQVIARLSERPDERRAIAAAAGELAAGLDWSEVAARFRRLYHRIA